MYSIGPKHSDKSLANKRINWSKYTSFWKLICQNYQTLTSNNLEIAFSVATAALMEVEDGTGDGSNGMPITATDRTGSTSLYSLQYTKSTFKLTLWC